MTQQAYIVEGATGAWEVVIGLEVHAQVTSRAKLFSGAATAFGAEPNTQVSLVDAAMPGMLPVPNRECIAQAVRTGLALDATINRWSRFDRKNYFYADLPQGYQISQLYHPLVGEGAVEIEPEEGATKTIGIERIHVEQDAGKLMHDQHPTRSYVDLNRSGVALMEIVSRPDMRSPAEAGAYLRKLRAILRYVGSCDGNMEQGSMRADVNVSVRKPGGELGTRTETKNVNSVRFVMQAIEGEARRQVDVLEAGGTIVQETRLFDPDRGETRSMRSKEDAQDYRYFPDPDLLPLELEEGWIEELRASLPELPDAKRRRYEAAGITAYNAGVLTAEVETARWFDQLLDAGAKPSVAANWVTSSLMGELNARGLPFATPANTPAASATILAMVADGTLSGGLAKEVLGYVLETGEDPAAIVEARGLKQTSDTGAIEAEIARVLAANPDKVAEYRGGKDKLFGFFVGQTMRAMGGKANPAVVNELLKTAPRLNAMAEPARVGVVAIGRNEGARLRACLASVRDIGPVVYVDSGSTDGSQGEARALGVTVVDLPTPPKFTAARARNAGAERLPATEFVQFVDGDCEVRPGWIAAATAALDADPGLALVFGRRRERHPDGSVYNALADDEWDVAVGEVAACGGDVLLRRAAFEAAGRYPAEMIAGEEPDLCARLRAQGWRLARIDAEMTLHDADIRRFGQWWRRQERAGHAAAELAWRHPRLDAPDWRGAVRRMLLWGAVLPALSLLGLLLAAVGGPAWLLLAALWPALLALNVVRLTRRRQRAGLPPRLARVGAALLMLCKPAEARGVARFHLNRWRGTGSQLIEYKAPIAA